MSALASFLTFALGRVVVFSFAGEDDGDELRARFVPRRASIGEPYEGSRLLSHNIRSFGDISTSSSVFGLGSTKSLQFNLVTGVARFFVSILGGTMESTAAGSESFVSPDSSCSASWYLNLLSLFFVASDTGMAGLGLGV